MTKAKRTLIEHLSLIDVVIEILDARIPYSSQNPDIKALAKDKKHIIVLNKSDLADAGINKEWQTYFVEQGLSVVTANAFKGDGLEGIISISRDLMKEKIERLKAKGRIFVPVRAMIVGIPNVGKSTLINKILGKNVAKTGDKPGVTKGKQWLKPTGKYKDFELLDTPGILWPKFDDETVGLNLALTGAIADDIFDPITLSIHLVKRLSKSKPDALVERYNVTDMTASSDNILAEIAKNRAYKKRGDVLDIERAAIMLIDELRGGKLGRVSLERV